METTQKLYQLGVQAVYVGIEAGVLALSLNALLNLALSLLHHFLYSCGVDSAVLDKLFKGNSRNLSANLVLA